MKEIFTVLAVSAVFAICSCGSKEEYKGTSADLAMKELQKTDAKTSGKDEKAVERKIIKEGEISFETANINETKSLVVKAVQELNGYISKENVNDYPDRLEHKLVIRIPSANFDLLLKQISESVDKLDSKNIDVLDVTEEFIDIEARIKTKKELAERYKELLKQATKVDEILNIEKEIGQLQADIESVEGRMKYLKDRISYSTLTATYYQNTTSAFRFTTKFGEAFKTGWTGFLRFLVALTHLWIFILIGLATTYLIMWRNKKKKNNAA